MLGILKNVMLLGMITVTLAIGSAKATVLLYENYTPGTTDYNTGEWRELGNTLPFSSPSFGVDSPGAIKELTFTFTATTSVIPRHVFLPMLINGYNPANDARVVVDIIEVGGDGRLWHAAGSPETIAPTFALGDKKVDFSFTEGVTQETRIGYDYAVTVWTFYTDAQAFLSNVASDDANYYTANQYATQSERSDVVNEALATGSALSIHGDFVAVPEPGSLALTGMAALGFLFRRRRA